MSLCIIYGRAGTGKSEYCYNEIAKIIEQEKKIYIITPEQFSFTAERMLMNKIKSGAIFNAEVITFSRMAYRVINEVGGVVNTGITKSGKAMLVHSILSEQKNNLKFLGKSEENIDICLNAISEFKKHNITIENLKNEINNTKNMYLQAKLNDITTIFENYQKKIQGNYIDDTDLLTILAEKIEKTNMFNQSVIYIDEFSGYTEQEYEIIKKLIKIAKRVTITICTDNLIVNNNKDTDIFYSNKVAISKIIESNEFEKKQQVNSYRFKTKELEHIEKNLYENLYKIFENKTKNISLFLAKNQYSEVENIAKCIIKKVRDEGLRYRDIAVITKNTETYSSQIRAIFNKYNIPVFIDERRTLSQNPVIQYILSILEVINKNWSHESMFQYIKSGFVPIDKEDIYLLENYCIKWGIKHNKWLKEFKGNISQDKSKNEKTTKDTAELERLNEIRKQIITPLQQLKQSIKSKKTAKNITKELYNFLSEQKIEETLQEKIKKLNQNGKIDIANEYKESYKILINLFDEIVSLFNDEKMTFDKYETLLKVGLKNNGLGKIPEVADQVIVGDVDRTRSHKVKTLFIIGLNDGTFPSINNNEGFLNDKDREILKSDGIELAKGTIEKLYEDNFNIYKAFSTAENNLYISYASTDQEGRALRPSILIQKIKRLFPQIKETSDIITNKEDITTIETTYESLINNISRLKSGKSIENKWFNVYNYFNSKTEWKEKLKENIQGLKYTNQPTNIKQENIDKLYGNTLTTSVSKLEKYRSCPFSYYLQYGLRIKEKDELKVNSIDTGTFMHETIDMFFEQIHEEGIMLEEITENQIKERVETIVNENLRQNKNYKFSTTQKYKLLVIRLKRIIAKALKYIIQTITESKFTILGNEIEFAQNAKYKPIVLKLENGKKVELIGKIDRVDIGKSGGDTFLRIIDYKSSSKNIDLNDVYAGLQIQLLAYMDAVCKKENAKSAGVLYFGLIDQIIKTEKNLTTEQIEEKIKESFKMRGLILADINIVKMHDKTLKNGASKLVPAYIDKNGNLGKKTNGISSEQFEKLQKYIDKTIVQISNEILKGQIEVYPYYKKGKTPCQYCQYKSICGFNVGFSDNKYNYIGEEDKEKILERMNSNERAYK